MSNRTLPHLNYLGFQLLRPSPLLRDYVQDYWIVRSHATGLYREEFLHPTGGMGIIFNYGDPFTLDDQLITTNMCLDGVNSFSRRLNFTGQVYAIGIRFVTAGAYPFFEMPIFEIIDHPYDLTDLQLPYLHDIYEQLFLAKSIPQQMQILDDWLLKVLNENRLVSPLVYGTVNLLHQSQGQDFMQELGDKIGVSTRQLQRTYKTQVGISPKQYAKLVRVGSAREGIKHLDQFSLADVAYHMGYYDQAHMIREFKSVVGMTPGAYYTRHQARYETP